MKVRPSPPAQAIANDTPSPVPGPIPRPAVTSQQPTTLTPMTAVAAVLVPTENRKVKVWLLGFQVYPWLQLPESEI